MTNETDTSTQNEETVESTVLEVLLSLFLGEGTASADQITEGSGDGTVNVQDKRTRLLGGDVLNSKGEVEGLVVGEVLPDEVNNEDNTQIRVGLALDLVADTGNEPVGLSHRINELSRSLTRGKTVRELGSGTIKSTAESVTNGQETSNKRGDKVLAGTSSDDGVHSTGNGGTVVGGKLKNHLDEFASVGGKSSLKPKKRDDTTDTNLLLEDVGDSHTSVHELLASLVGDGRDESGGLPDETKFLDERLVEKQKIYKISNLQRPTDSP